VYSQRDYDLLGLRNDEKLIVISGHSEHWSDLGINQIRNHIRQNKSIIVTSGNTMYRKIKYIPQGISTDGYDSRIHMGDPNISFELLGTTLTYRLKENTPFKIIKRNHWIFDNITKNTFASENTEYPGGGCASEGDKFSNNKFTLLAQGITLGDDIDSCDMVIREFEKGNFILNFSSIGVNGSLMVDKETDIIYLNAIERALNN